MDSRAKLLGHSIHQMLITFPVGLLTTAAFLDLAGLVVHVPELPAVSFWNLVLGCIAALVAAVFGAIDLSVVPLGTRASRVGLLHASANMVAVICFALAVLARSTEAALTVTPAALVLELVGLGTVMVGGWLGGELVDRLGIGVDENAHPNASSSLTHRPITAEDFVAPRIAHPEPVGVAAPDTDARAR
jgi:uncharacterized membrane protein